MAFFGSQLYRKIALTANILRKIFFNHERTSRYVMLLIFFIGYMHLQLCLMGENYFGIAPDEGFHGLLAEAFLKGQLNLDITVDPKLEQCVNPYDPSLRPPHTQIAWDISYFRQSKDLYLGKYYLYFGPAPALLLYCPYKLLTKQKLSRWQAFQIIATLNLIFYFFFITTFLSLFELTVPFYIESLLFVVYGFCNLSLYLQCRSEMYQISICFATATALAFFLCLLRSLSWGKWRFLWLFLTSCSAGLAFGSRQVDCALYGILLLFLGYIWWTKKDWSPFKLIFSWETIALLSPAFLMALALLWYNYARFENPFEFGLRYQLNTGNCSVQFMNPRYIPDSIWNYYIAPWTFKDCFPYLDSNSLIWCPYFHYDRPFERFTGLLTSFPIDILALSWPFYGFYYSSKQKRALYTILGIMVSFWLIAITCLTGSFFGETFRYEMEFQMPLLLLSSLTLLSHTGLKTHRFWQKLLLYPLIVYSCFFGIFYGLTGEGHWLQNDSARQFGVWWDSLKKML